MSTLSPARSRLRRVPAVVRSPDLWLPLLLLSIYTSVQMRFLLPPRLDDMLNYFQAASHLPDVRGSHQELRIGLLFPVRLFQEVFGYSELAYYAVPLLCMMLLLVSTYLLGATLFDRWVGMGAGLLLLSSPYLMQDASHLLPDVPAASLLTAGLAVLAITLTRDRGEASMTSRRRTLALGAAGFLLGWAYLIREFSPLMYPLVVGFVLISRKPLRSMVPVAVGALVPLVIELLWGGIVYGNPFIRMGIVASPRSADPALFATEAMEVILMLPTRMLEDGNGAIWVLLLGMAMAAGAVAALPSARRGDGARGLALVSFWVIGVWAFLTLVGLLPILLLDEEAVFLRLHKLRYWTPIFPAVAVAGLGAAQAAVRWLVQRLGFSSEPWTSLGSVAVAVVATAGFVGGLSALKADERWVGSGNDHYLEMRQYLASEEAARFDKMWLIDGVWRASTRVVPMYTKTPFGRELWSGETIPLNEGPSFLPEEEVGPGLVLFHRRAMESVFHGSRAESAAAGYVRVPPKDWRTEFVAENSSLAFFSVGGPVAGSSTSLALEMEAPDWRFIPRRDADVDESRIAMEGERLKVVLEAGERGFFVDNQTNGFQPPPDGPPLREGYLRGRVWLRTSHLPRVDIRCVFYPTTDAADRFSVDALAAPPPAGGSDVGFICPSPDGPWPMEGVRVSVRAVGPVEAEVGRAEIWYEDSP